MIDELQHYLFQFAFGHLAVHGLDGCYLYDIDDLEAVVAETLTDRRAEEQSEFRNTERGLAFIQASSLLDCNCGLIEGKSDWFDISDYPEDLSGEIDEAVEYLEARGLLEHDPANYNHCSIRNESEATA